MVRVKTPALRTAVDQTAEAIAAVVVGKATASPQADTEGRAVEIETVGVAAVNSARGTIMVDVAPRGRISDMDLYRHGHSNLVVVGRGEMRVVVRREMIRVRRGINVSVVVMVIIIGVSGMGGIAGTVVAVTGMRASGDPCRHSSSR